MSRLKALRLHTRWLTVLNLYKICVTQGGTFFVLETKIQKKITHESQEISPFKFELENMNYELLDMNCDG